MSCDDNYNIAKEYICPSVGCQKGSGKKRRSLSQLGGDCFYAGESMAINRACPPNDKKSLSELAWNMRGGDGYSMMPDKPIGGMLGRMRYTDTCRPVFPGNLTQKAGSKRGLITELSYFSKNRKFKSKKLRDIYKEINGGDCDKCSFTMPKKGGMSVGPLRTAIVSLGKMLSPMGKNSLATVIVLLFVNYMYKNKKVTSKNQLGGGLYDYVKILLPMTKNNLIVLASILLLNHYVCNKRSRSKKQKGGNMIMNEVGKLLAPLGVNSLGTSIILVILNQAIKKKKIQKGGSVLHPLVKLVAPLGVNAFVSTGVLVLLKRMFELKSKREKGSKQKGGSMASLLVELKKLLAPLGVNAFVSTAALVGLKKYKKKSSKKNKRK